MQFDLEFCIDLTAMKQIPTSQVFAPRREPCSECGMPVFIAERLRIPHTPRTQNGGEEDSGGGKSESSSQQSFLLMHRTCFRCARCHQQLSPAGGYYETESGAFCCEVCPDEEPPSPISEHSRSIRGDPEGMLAVGTDDEASDFEDEADVAAGSILDSYSEDFESALEASGEGASSSAGDADLPKGAKKISNDSLSPAEKKANDGADSSETVNSSFISLKSHHESSPIAKSRRNILQENGFNAHIADKPSEHKVEEKEPESQIKGTDESQLGKRLQPVGMDVAQEDSCSDGVVLRKDGSRRSNEEVPRSRQFSVFDRVRMFENEVNVRQSSLKDIRVEKASKVKDGNTGKGLSEVKFVNDELNVKSSNDSVESKSLVEDEDVKNSSCRPDNNSRVEDVGAPEQKRVESSIEDIPFMDESSDFQCNDVVANHSPVVMSTESSNKEDLIDVAPKVEVLNAPSPEENVNLPSEDAMIPTHKDELGVSEGKMNVSAIDVGSVPTEEEKREEITPEKFSTLAEKTEEVNISNELSESIPNSKDSSNLSEECVSHVNEECAVKDDTVGREIEEISGANEISLAEQSPETTKDDEVKGESPSVNETVTFVLEPPKVEDVSCIMETGNVVDGRSEKVEYPDDLNPFGDDEEEEEEAGRKVPKVIPRKQPKASLNPFGSSDEEDEEDANLMRKKKSPIPAMRRSVPALDSVGRVKEPSAEDKLNPFWSPGEDNDVDVCKERARRKSATGSDAPVPKPRTVWSSGTSTPEPSPLPRRGVSPSPSADSTLIRRRRKKPAPPPPVQQNAQTTPTSHGSSPPPHLNASDSLLSSPSKSLSPGTSPGGTPRRPRKSRPAPPRPISPPAIESPPSVAEDTPLIPPESNKTEPSKGDDAPVDDGGLLSKEDDSKLTDSPSPSSRPPPESEKRQKDAENRNRRSKTSGGDEEEVGKDGSLEVVTERAPDKSTFGQWKRKKGPAPPRPLPQKRKLNPHVPMSEIRQELCDIEVQQMELERQGVALERDIRSRFQQEDSPNDAWIPAEVEAQVLQLFELVNEKNELFRRQAELMYMRRQQRLEEEHADLEFQIRCLMERPASLKTDADKEREEMLIQRLVEVVEARDEVVQCLESDRLREVQEDVTVRACLAGAFPGKAADKGEALEEEGVVEGGVSLGEKGKKSKKEKKVWERMKKKVVGKKGSGGVLHLGKGKKKKDADKDVDEVEEEGRRKEGGDL